MEVSNGDTVPSVPNLITAKRPPAIPAMQINGVAVRVIRQRSGVTSTDLAKAAGVSQALLSLIECGRRNSSPKTIKAIAEALMVPLPAILKNPEAAA